MSPGQVLGVHQADLLLPRDMTVQSDGEVVGRRNDLLGRQDHGARAAPENTPVLAARRMVARKDVHQHRDATRWPVPCCCQGDPVLTPALGPGGPGPAPSPGEEEPEAGAWAQLWGRPVAVNSEDVVVEASDSSGAQPWEQ